ncbi:TPA: PTS glucitol/sorbitol transporter subunit IIA [Streptococcus suis]|nr:PTS glucitol/sorbitol transporter subunit IIA [Streptococcus suis]
MVEFEVLEIGEMVPLFEEEMLIVLFGEQAPPELKSICVVHNYHSEAGNLLREGTILELGDNKYKLTKVGSMANSTFDELGHVSIYFRSTEEEILPGSILAEPRVFPKVKPGDKIRIINS